MEDDLDFSKLSKLTTTTADSILLMTAIVPPQAVVVGALVACTELLLGRSLQAPDIEAKEIMARFVKEIHALKDATPLREDATNVAKQPKSVM